MTGVRAGSQGTGMREGSQGTGVAGGGPVYQATNAFHHTQGTGSGIESFPADAGAVEGDLLLAIGAVRTSLQEIVEAWTFPWTKIMDSTTTPTGPHLSTGHRIATAGSAGVDTCRMTYNFTTSAKSLGIMRFSGVDPEAPIGNIATGGLNAATITVPDFTTTVPGSLVVLFLYTSATTYGFEENDPTSWTHVWNEETTVGGAQITNAFIQEMPSVGTIPSEVFSRLLVSDYSSAYQIIEILPG